MALVSEVLDSVSIISLLFDTAGRSAREEKAERDVLPAGKRTVAFNLLICSKIYSHGIVTYHDGSVLAK